jgi:hypothetical protein
MDKIKTDEGKPFAWTVFNFDTYADMEAFQRLVNELYRHVNMMSNEKTMSITGEVKA